MHSDACVNHATMASCIMHLQLTGGTFRMACASQICKRPPKETSENDTRTTLTRQRSRQSQSDQPLNQPTNQHNATTTTKPSSTPTPHSNIASSLACRFAPQNSEAALVCTEIDVTGRWREGRLGMCRCRVAAACAEVCSLGVRSTHLYPAALM